MGENTSIQSGSPVLDGDDSVPVAVMDGDCGLCAFGARLIDRLDRSGEIRIATIQTPLGAALLKQYGLVPADPESWLFIENGVAYEGFDAMMRVGLRLGGGGHLLRAFAILPKSLRARLYRWIARNRYRLFGRKNLCNVPSPTLRARLIE